MLIISNYDSASQYDMRISGQSDDFLPPPLPVFPLFDLPEADGTNVFLYLLYVCVGQRQLQHSVFQPALSTYHVERGYVVVLAQAFLFLTAQKVLLKALQVVVVPLVALQL